MKTIKTTKFKNKLKQDITQNYNICQMLLGEAGKIGSHTYPIKYQQLIYLLFNGRIPINKIAYFKNKKYKNQQPLMRKSFVIQDAVKMNQQIISKAWKYQKVNKGNKMRSISVDQSIKVKNKVINEFQTIDAKDDAQQKSQLNVKKEVLDKIVQSQNNNFPQIQNRQKILEQNKFDDVKKQVEIKNKQVSQQKNEQIIQQALQNGPKKHSLKQKSQKKLSPIQQKHTRSLTTKSQQKTKIKEKINELSQFLKIIQSKINTSKTQIQAAQNQKQYNKVFKQVSALRNRKRIQKQNKLLEKITIENSSNIPQNIEKILNKMKQIKVSNAKKLNKSPGYNQKISKFQQIERINSIFKFYTIKQITNSNRYFSNMQKQQSKLNLQTFIKFAKQFELNRIISMQQISHIFKTRSKGNRYIDILQFNEILTDIHNYECIKEQKQISNQSIGQYIQQYIVNDKKMNKVMMNNSQSYKQKSQKQSKYKYQPHCHSGKYLADIKQMIQERKKNVQHLAGPKNIIKYKNKSGSKKQITFANESKLNTNINSRVQTQSISQTIRNNMKANTPSNNQSFGSSMFYDNNINSYAFRFKLKNVKNRIKTEGIMKAIQKQEKQQQQSKQQQITLKNENLSKRQQQLLQSPRKSQQKRNSNKIKQKSKKSQNNSYESKTQIQKNQIGSYSKKEQNTQKIIKQQQQDSQQQNLTIQNILNNKNTMKLLKMNKNKNKSKEQTFEGFEDLIQDSQQDQYLNKHLFPTIPMKKVSRTIHY